MTTSFGLGPPPRVAPLDTSVLPHRPSYQDLLCPVVPGPKASYAVAQAVQMTNSFREVHGFKPLAEPPHPLWKWHLNPSAKRVLAMLTEHNISFPQWLAFNRDSGFTRLFSPEHAERQYRTAREVASIRGGHVIVPAAATSVFKRWVELEALVRAGASVDTATEIAFPGGIRAACEHARKESLLVCADLRAAERRSQWLWGEVRAER